MNSQRPATGPHFETFTFYTYPLWMDFARQHVKNREIGPRHSEKKRGIRKGDTPGIVESDSFLFQEGAFHVRTALIAAGSEV